MAKLDKMSSEEHVSISKKMFYGGFAFLPFLWLVNFIYFYKTSRKPYAPNELKKCKKRKRKKKSLILIILVDIYLSLTGCIFWFILLTTWYALFVNKRVAWGEGGDRITVVIPKGI